MTTAEVCELLQEEGYECTPEIIAAGRKAGHISQPLKQGRWNYYDIIHLKEIRGYVATRRKRHDVT